MVANEVQELNLPILNNINLAKIMVSIVVISG